MIPHPICPYAGCNSPEGECLGVCCADSRGHTVKPIQSSHSPASAWADKQPYRWPAIAVVVSTLVLGAYGFMFVSDEMTKQKEAEAVRTKAEQAELQRRALQDKCGGPEATVTATASGCESINKRGKKTVISRSSK